MSQQRADRTNVPSGSVDLTADVLVIGGGPAGTWAACSAAWRGATVVLVDKGYCGTSGATAPSGTGVWYVPPDPAIRSAAMASREKMGGYLQDRRWMQRVLDRTYESVNLLAEWGYPFPTDDNGQSRRTSLQGPEYMRLMRRRVGRAGVTILDHRPALELLTDSGGRPPPAERHLGRARQGRCPGEWRLRVSEQSPGLRCVDRRRLPDGSRSRRGSLGHGILQRLCDRARVCVGD